MPEVCRFKETILQSAIRRYLMHFENLRRFLVNLDLPIDQVDSLEILGEKALPQGHIDLLLKQRVPLGSSFKIPIEVKVNRGSQGDISQLRAYMDELRGDCQVGVLIAADFGKNCGQKATANGIQLVRYKLNADLKHPVTFDEISYGLDLAVA